METAKNKIGLTVAALKTGEIVLNPGSACIPALAFYGDMNTTFTLSARIKFILPEPPKKYPRKDRLALRADIQAKKMGLIYIKNPYELIINIMPIRDMNIIYAKIADVILMPNGTIGVINYG